MMRGRAPVHTAMLRPAIVGLCLALLLVPATSVHAFFPIGGFDSFNVLRLGKWRLSDFDTNNDGSVDPGEGLEILIEGGPSGFSDTQIQRVRDAFQVWEDVPTAYPAFRFVGITQDPLLTGIEPDFRTVVATQLTGEFGALGEGFEPDRAESIIADLTDGVLGITLVLYAIEDTIVDVPGFSLSVSAGTIIDSDIVINGDVFSAADSGLQEETDMMGTLVHEIGHFLGLDHTPLNNVRPLLTDPIDPSSEVGLVENEVFWMTQPDGSSRFVGVTPTMYPLAFHVDSGSSVRQNGSIDLAPDDISGISWLYPRGSQANFFQLSQEARSQVREGSGLPTTPLPGGHVVAWADIDNNPDTAPIPMFSTMTGLYEPFGNVELVGRFILYGMWKQFELPGGGGALFNPPYVFTLSPLNGTGYPRQAPFGLLPENVDSLQGPTSLSISTRTTTDYTNAFASEVFHEVDNIVDVSNKNVGTPIIWSFERNTLISADTQRTLPAMLGRGPMFGDPNDVCPLNLIFGEPTTDGQGDGGDGGGGGTEGEGEGEEEAKGGFLAFSGPSGPNGSGGDVVYTLRAFRDTVLLQSYLGTAAVDLYYQAAPHLTRFLIQHGTARNGFKQGVLFMFWIVNHASLLAALLLVASGALALDRLRRGKRHAAVLGLVLCALLCGTPSHALLAFVSTSELAADSSAVVAGKVLSAEGRWARGGRIYTDVVFLVDDSAKGAINKQSTVTFSVIGGRVGGLVMHASEMPTFESGDEVLMYLKERPGYGYVVNSGQRGALPISTNAKTGEKFVHAVGEIAEKALAEDAQAIAKSGGVADASDAEGEAEAGIPLEDYLEYVRALVQDQTQAGN